MRDGKRVRRERWYFDAFAHIVEGELIMEREASKFARYTVVVNDFLKDDWEVFGEDAPITEKVIVETDKKAKK